MLRIQCMIKSNKTNTVCIQRKCQQCEHLGFPAAHKHRKFESYHRIKLEMQEKKFIHILIVALHLWHILSCIKPRKSQGLHRPLFMSVSDEWHTASMELPGEHGHALGQEGDTAWMDKGQQQPQVMSLLWTWPGSLSSSKRRPWPQGKTPGFPPGDWISSLTVCVSLTESLHCSGAPPMNAE